MDKCSQKVKPKNTCFIPKFKLPTWHLENNIEIFSCSVRLLCSPSLVVAFPAAPTPSPTLAYPAVPSYLPEESAGAEDLPDPAGTASLALDSAPLAEMQGVAQVPEQPDDLLQQQLPRQIHIQQHLKLHFHQQGKSWRG